LTYNVQTASDDTEAGVYPTYIQINDHTSKDKHARFVNKIGKRSLNAQKLGLLKNSLKTQGISALSQEEYEFVRKSLADFKEEIDGEIRLGKTVLGSAMAASVGLSAGYVIWMLKGGSLLASVLSSLPAWQLADPLAILGRTRDEEDEDEESLETIINKGSSQKDSKKDTDSDVETKEID
jgi:hypothetical protein